VNTLPDFIIIGAMKCATSTLHQQLARQRGICMSMPKEPNFFSDDRHWSRGLDWYGSLFDAAQPGDLCGESSTHYTKLPTYPHTIERMTRCLGERTRFVYIMRHPVDRLVSHYVHDWSRRKVSVPIDTAIDRHPELVAYGRYAMQLKPYLARFGPERVLPVFFDRLAMEPQEELARVCEFIGYRRRPAWNRGAGKENESSRRIRRTAFRDMILDCQALRSAARRLIPKGIRSAVEEAWSVKERPEPSRDRRMHLEKIFDQDLRIVGDWMGMRLSCATFKRIGRTAAASWAIRRMEDAA